MPDFKIKDTCEKCGGTEDLDGVLNPFLGEDKTLNIESATLCSPCREKFKKSMEKINANKNFNDGL